MSLVCQLLTRRDRVVTVPPAYTLRDSANHRNGDLSPSPYMWGKDKEER
jgi:hypothetical protein